MGTEELGIEQVTNEREMLGVHRTTPSAIEATSRWEAQPWIPGRHVIHIMP
jgi:hypothetical protein